METSEAYARVNALTQEQRDSAYTQARSRIAGNAPTQTEAPKLDDFRGASIDAKFPPVVANAMTAFTFALLLFAFLPSAIRIHDVALNLQENDMQLQGASAYVMAICAVMLAEIGQVLFSIASANANKKAHRFALNSGAAICTLIALSGNASAMGTHSTQSLFAFLETYAPPVLVLIASSVLKSQILDAVETSHRARLAFKVAFDEWKANHELALATYAAAMDNAHLASEWDKTLANAIRDALRFANRQSKAVLRELTVQDWLALVRRERASEEWWIEAERIETQSQARALPKASGVASGHTTNEVINAIAFQRGDVFIKECPHCQERFEGETTRQATNRLAAHMKRHKNERKAQDAIAMPILFSTNGKH